MAQALVRYSILLSITLGLEAMCVNFPKTAMSRGVHTVIARQREYQCRVTCFSLSSPRHFDYSHRLQQNAKYLVPRLWSPWQNKKGHPLPACTWNLCAISGSVFAHLRRACSPKKRRSSSACFLALLPVQLTQLLSCLIKLSTIFYGWPCGNAVCTDSHAGTSFWFTRCPSSIYVLPLDRAWEWGWII